MTASRRRIRAVFLGLASFCLILLLWEASIRGFHVRAVVLPAPSDILAELVADMAWYLSNAWHTLITTLFGFLLALVIGIFIAVLLVGMPWFESTIYPLIISFNSVPKVAVAPLFVVWLGTGVKSQVAISFLIAVFAIIVDSAHGLRSIPADVVDLGRILKGTRFDIFFKIRLPCALPSILAGAKIAISLALVGAIVGEFVASEKGLGYIILSAQGSFEMPRVFAALFLLGGMGMLLFTAIEIVERRMLAWRYLDEQST